MKASFPKQCRLRKRPEFQKIIREAKRRVGRFLCVDCRMGKQLKIGITASGRYGSAIERNRFKRLVREVFRLNQTAFPANWELHVVPRQNAKRACYQDVQEELLKLLRSPL